MVTIFCLYASQRTHIPSCHFYSSLTDHLDLGCDGVFCFSVTTFVLSYIGLLHLLYCEHGD